MVLLPAVVFAWALWYALPWLGRGRESSTPHTSESVALLTSRLADSDATVRAAAAHSLGRERPASAEAVAAVILALGHALEDRSDEVAAAAASALAAYGADAAPAVPRLMSVLVTRPLWVRLSATRALGDIGPPATAAEPALLMAMRDKEPLQRATAADAVVRIGAVRGALPALRSLLGDADAGVRRAAVRALAAAPGELAGPAVPELRARLADGAPEVRVEAPAALAGIAAALPELRGTIEPALIAALERARAVSAGGDDAGSDDAGSAGGENFDDVFAGELCMALGRCCPGRAALAAITPVLRHPDHSVRKLAVLGVGAMGPLAAPAAPELARLLDGEEIYLRVWAAEALGKMGPAGRAGLPALRVLANRGYADLQGSPEAEASQLPGAVQLAIARIEGRAPLSDPAEAEPLPAEAPDPPAPRSSDP